jgi:hypothetical protein
MFPDAHNRPAQIGQQTIHDGIAILVAGNFRVPVPSWIGWHSTMRRTAMPEAPVHEDGDPLSWENQIRPDSSARQINSQINAVPITPGK